MRKEIEQLLLKLGISPGLKGFYYLIRAIEISTKGKVDVCKGVYEVIANECEETAQRVERNIRHAITKMDKEVYKQYGGRYYANSDVIFTLALHFKEE